MHSFRHHGKNTHLHGSCSPATTADNQSGRVANQFQRGIRALPEEFNDISYLAGLSPSLHFQDITLPVVSAQASPQGAAALVPTCHAVVLALKTKTDGRPLLSAKRDRDGDGQGRGDQGEQSSTRPGSPIPPATTQWILWFEQTVVQIPDIYALVHAVLNCPASIRAIEHNSIFDRMAQEARRLPPARRAAVVQQARDLQKAFTKAVTNGPWAAVAAASPAPQTNPLPAAAPAPTSSSASSAPLTSPPACHFYFCTFVQSPDTGAIFAIDSSGPVCVDDPRQRHQRGSSSSSGRGRGGSGGGIGSECGGGGVPLVEHTQPSNSVLTPRVVQHIRSIVGREAETNGRGQQAIEGRNCLAVGLVLRDC